MIFNIILLVAAFFVAWTIGAISISPSFGPAANFGKFGVLRGALLAGIFGFLGATTQGGEVAETIGSGLITGAEISIEVNAIILIVSAVLISIGIITNIPIPTVFVVVGGVLGAGLAIEGALWNMAQVRTLTIVWILTPFLAMGISYAVSKAIRTYIGRSKRERMILGNILILVGAFSAYAGGANKIGLAIGLIEGQFEVSLLLLLVAGGLFILLGAWLGGPGIVNAVSKDYSEMGVRRAISALASAGILAQVATVLGIPISLNEAIIGAVIGCGLAGGVDKIEGGKIGKTVLEWVGTLFASMGFIFAIVYLVF